MITVSALFAPGNLPGISRTAFSCLVSTPGHRPGYSTGAASGSKKGWWSQRDSQMPLIARERHGPVPGRTRPSSQGDSSMETSKMPGEAGPGRRRFLGTAGAAALAVGAAQLGVIGAANAQTIKAGSAGLPAASLG